MSRKRNDPLGFLGARSALAARENSQRIENPLFIAHSCSPDGVGTGFEVCRRGEL